MMLTSKENNKALEDSNNKLLEIINDSGILANYSMSLLSKNTNPENNFQFKLLKDSNSKRVRDFLIHNTRPVSLYYNLLTFRDTDKKFVLQGDPLKMITNRSFNIDYANLTDEKIVLICKGNES